ncbi:uncharacterized protein LOC135391969 [Ornithodoros turicata]|uniref:uncharacterized protein LOC135391969 n=1 Tax=Ornithodoros turicata TaxID=34597 RepID=UPI003139042B
MAIERPDHKDWDKSIQEIQRNLNTTRSKTTQKTPFQVLYGFNARHQDSQLRALDADDFPQASLDHVRQTAKDSIERQQTKQGQHYNLRRRAAPKYDVGDIVVVKRLPVHTGDRQRHSKSTEALWS